MIIVPLGSTNEECELVVGGGWKRITVNGMTRKPRARNTTTVDILRFRDMLVLARKKEEAARVSRAAAHTKDGSK